MQNNTIQKARMAAQKQREEELAKKNAKKTVSSTTANNKVNKSQTSNTKKVEDYINNNTNKNTTKNTNTSNKKGAVAKQVSEKNKNTNNKNKRTKPKKENSNNENRIKAFFKKPKTIATMCAIFICFLIVFIPTITAVALAYPNEVYAKENPVQTKVGYSAEYLGNVKRNIPNGTSEGGLSQTSLKDRTDLDIATKGYPVYGRGINYTTEEKSALIAEADSLCANGTRIENNRTQNASYDCMDATGKLYTNDGTVKGQLYKHISSVGQYRGNVSDDEPAIVKRLRITERGSGYNITGLYAPAGEVIKIEVSKADFETTDGFVVLIGQALYNFQANNIWASKTINRMPVILNQMTLNNATFSKDVDKDGNYTFYVGSFIGGPLYISPITRARNSKYVNFSVTISGAVKYSHFVLGYTSKAEFEQNAKSTAPYFDLMVWDRGVLHSGPKVHAQNFSYEQLYDAAVLWDKISLVSSRYRGATCGIVMLYDPFVAAGAAVAFPGRNSVNCPDGWMSGSLNYNAFVTSGAWGNVHEFNHNYQGWGMSGYCDEVTNNALSLVSYSLFTKISSARTIGSVNENLGGWNRYTSPSWSTRQVCTSRENDLSVYSTLLHSFGQDNFVIATQRGGIDNYFTLFSETTHNDLNFFTTLVGRNMSQSVKDTMSSKNYPMFVPVSSIYQTGRSYMYDGVKRYTETAQPYVINYGEEFKFDLNPYLFNGAYYTSGSVALPTGINYTITKVTNPKYGKVKKLEEGIYSFTPDKKNLRSGKFYATLHFTTTDEFKAQYGDFKIDDVDLVLEFEQTHEKNKFVLERTTYFPTENAPNYETVEDVIKNNFEGYTKTYEGNNINSSQNSNTDVWGYYNDTPNNTVFEVTGKLYIENDGDYRIAMRSRWSSAVYLSFDGGKTYKPEDSIIINDNTGSGIGHVNYNRNQVVNSNGTVGAITGTAFGESPWALDYRGLKAGSWIYFKEYVKRHPTLAVDKDISFVGLLIGEWEQPKGYIDDATGEIVINGQTIEHVTVKYATAYRASYENVNKKFESEYFYTRDYNFSYQEIYSAKTLPNAKIISGSECETNYPLENLLVDSVDPKVACHSKNLVSNKPFEVTVDLGKEIEANRCIIQGYLVGSSWHTPSSFTLYVGTSLDNMEEVASFNNAGNNDTSKQQFNFDTTKFRYYKLYVTATNRNRYVAISYINFEFNIGGGKMYSPDNNMFIYKGNWKAQSEFSNFGHIYTGKKTSMEFIFLGNRFAINSYVSKNFDSFDVIIDGMKINTTSINGNENCSKVVYMSNDLGYFVHKVEIRSRKNFNIDSIILWQ